MANSATVVYREESSAEVVQRLLVPCEEKLPWPEQSSVVSHAFKEYTKERVNTYLGTALLELLREAYYVARQLVAAYDLNNTNHTFALLTYFAVASDAQLDLMNRLLNFMVRTPGMDVDLKRKQGVLKSKDGWTNKEVQKAIEEGARDVETRKEWLWAADFADVAARWKGTGGMNEIDLAAWYDFFGERESSLRVEYEEKQERFHRVLREDEDLRRFFEDAGAR